MLVISKAIQAASGGSSPVPAVPFMVGQYYMRETRQRLRKLALGEARQLTVASIGDSYTHSTVRWSEAAYRTLHSTFGLGGKGWCGFGALAATYLYTNGNINDTLSYADTVGFTGAWSYNYCTSPSPDISSAYSSSVGAKISVVGAANCSAVRLFYIPTDGNVRYRWNGGTWAALSLASGTGLSTVLLAGFPSIVWTLEIEVVSGTVEMCGVDLQSSANGVTWHKIASTGSAASQWQAVNGSQWQAAMTALAPHLVIIMLGTNDQGMSTTPAIYGGYMQNIITRIKNALPSADILLVAVPENGRTNTYPMSDYATELYDLSVANKCGFLNMQYVFGEHFSQYSAASTRPWWSTDLVHPNAEQGGRAMVDAIIKYLTTG